MADFSHVTICFSLPRSRSQWLAHLYSQAARVDSWHDPLKDCASPRDLVAKILASKKPKIFIADTSAILFHSQLRVLLPGARFLYVLRDPKEVCRSIARQLNTDASLIIGPMHKRLQERIDMIAHQVTDYTTYGDIETFARDWWPDITGADDNAGDDWWRWQNMTVIDKPLRKQTFDRFKTLSLLRHSEIR